MGSKSITTTKRLKKLATVASSTRTTKSPTFKNSALRYPTELSTTDTSRIWGTPISADIAKRLNRQRDGQMNIMNGPILITQPSIIHQYQHSTTKSPKIDDRKTKKATTQSPSLTPKRQRIWAR